MHASLLHAGATNDFDLDPAVDNQMKLSTGQIASIDLPPSLFERVNDHSTIGLFYGLYSDPTLFPDNTQNTDSKLTKVISPVLATTLGPNINVEGLRDNVTILLRTNITDLEVDCFIAKHFTFTHCHYCMLLVGNQQYTQLCDLGLHPPGLEHRRMY